MINLFKKLTSSQTTIAEQPKTKSVTEVIEEMHESFYTEVDRLLADARIAKSLDTDKQGLIDKCDRLKSLGFTNTKEVKEGEAEILRLMELKRENESKKSLIEAINYFSFKYPNYKFISEESVKKICQKYGLVYGKVDNYLGTVPDKNLAQMEQFKVEENDELYFYETWTTGWNDGPRLLTSGYFTKTQHDYHNQERRDYRPIDSRYKWELCDKSPLEIAAPVKDFRTDKRMEIKDFKIMEIPDPVVLKPVIFKGEKYYLIVTAWGIEASDPDVVNEKMN